MFKIYKHIFIKLKHYILGGCSSVGRALASQARCRGFDPRRPLMLFVSEASFEKIIFRNPYYGIVRYLNVKLHAACCSFRGLRLKMSIKVSPYLHKLLTTGKDNPLQAEYKIEANKDGTPNVLKSGRLVHSKYNIERESQSVLNANIDIESRKNIFAFYGFGLGHHVSYFAKEFASKLKNVPACDVHIIILVTDIPLFVYAYFNMVMGEIAKYNTMFLHYDEDIELGLRDIEIDKMMGVNFIMLPSIEREYKNLAGSIHTSILEKIETKFSDLFTRLHFENLWIKNILKNTTSLDKYPSATSFRGVLKGLNALIIAAGPTLNHHVEAIKQNRGDLFLIATDTAIGCLSANGIVADIVITMDAGIYNVYDFIYNKLDFSYLFTDIISQPSVLKINDDKSNIVLFSSNENSNLIGHIEQRLGVKIERFNTSFTVATAAIELANFLGISHALLLGFDNSFPNYERHAKHTLSFDYGLLRTNRLNTMESMYFDTIAEQSNLESYPPSSYILESQIDYLSRLEYENMNIIRICSGAIAIDAIDKDVAIEQYASTNMQSLALSRLESIYNNTKTQPNKDKIASMYAEIRTIFTSLAKSLHENYNAIISFTNDDNDSVLFYDEKLAEIVCDIKTATEKVKFLKNILSHSSIVVGRSGAASREKALLLSSEAIKSINYFNTRIEQIEHLM